MKKRSELHFIESSSPYPVNLAQYFVKLLRPKALRFSKTSLAVSQPGWYCAARLISISDCSIKIIKILANRTVYSIEIIQ